MRYHTNWILRIAVVSGLVGSSANDLAAQSRDELTTMSLESLMNVQVTSVSRREEKLHGTAGAIYVITREDIRRSGATDIADLLRMVPGMNVAQLTGSVWAVSARGFASQYATKMLVLVDGRTVYDPSFSGVYWHLQNVVLADIDRIEVIRGPGATMWGSNSVNGVINITTQTAAETQKGFLTVDAGTARPGEGTLRYGATAGDNASFRVFGRQTTRSSLATDAGGHAGDAWNLTTTGLRLDGDLSDKNALTVEAGAYRGHQESRQQYLGSRTPPTYETVGRQGNSGGHVRTRFTRNVDADATFTFQFFYDRRKHTGYAAKTIDVFDFETQYDFPIGERHHVTLGGGTRHIHDRFENSLAFGFTEPHLDSNLANLYVQDDISIVEDSLDVSLGVKLERSSFTGYNVQPTARLSWRPGFRHTVWASLSRAVRTANRVERGLYITLDLLEAGPNVGVVTLFGRGDTRSEKLVAYETGYRYQPNERLWLDVATFYNVYDDLSTVAPGDPFVDIESFPPHVVAPLYFGNEMHGRTYGAEVAVNREIASFWTLRGNISMLVMDLESDEGDVAETERFAGNAPRYQAYAGSFLTLPAALELAANAYFVDELPASDISAYTRIDLNLTWKTTDRLELSLVGQNLLGARVEFHDVEATPVSSIDRRIFGKIAWRF